MLKEIELTGSYLQNEPHAKVSSGFNVVRPAMVGEVMSANGLTLSSLSTGRAKHEDKIDFQRTLSRYRGPEIADKVYLDVVYDSKHMGRGVDRILLGIYRMVCTNGLFVGMNFFKHDIRHNGNTYDSLQIGIAEALKCQDKLTATIERMQGIQLTVEQRQLFASEAVTLLTPAKAVSVTHRLLAPQREVDKATDLWTTYNVIQENAMQGRNVGYVLQESNEQGNKTRVMHTRTIKPNSGKDADFNSKLFDIAEKFAA